MKENYPELGNPGGKKHPEGAEIKHPSGTVYRRVNGNWVLVKLILLSLLLWATPAWGVACTETGSGSVLENAANNLTAGNWCQATNGTNMNTVLGDSGSSGFIFGFAMSGVYDPVTDRIWYIGSDHPSTNSTLKFAQLDLATNAWTTLSRPAAWGCDPCTTGAKHGYDLTDIDTRGGYIYRRNFDDETQWKWNIDSPAWTQMTTPSSSIISVSTDCCPASEFHPDVSSHGRVYQSQADSGTNGPIYHWDVFTDTWTRGSSVANTATTHMGAVYCEKHKAVFIGGGSSGAVNRINQDGTVTTMETAPQAWGPNHGVAVCDPISGEIILVGNDVWYAFDPVDGADGAWRTLSGNADPNTTSSTSSDVHGLIAIPVNRHGVMVFLKCKTGTKPVANCETWVYKHATSTDADRDFKRRQWARGVINAFDFDSTVITAGNTFEGVAIIDSGSGGTAPALDTGTKASGTSSIKMTVPTASGANAAGSWNDNFRRNGSRTATATASVSGNKIDEFYVSWRQRFNCDFLFSNCPTATTPRDFSGGGGWKLAIIGTGDRTGVDAFSCSDLETVVQNTEHRGLPQMYRSCDGPFSFDPLDEPNGASGFWWQNAKTRVNTSSGCFYPSTTAGCFMLAEDDWMSFQVHIKVASWYNGTGCGSDDCVHDSIVELWGAREGDDWTLLISYKPRSLSCDSESGDYIPNCGQSAPGGTGLPFWRSTSAPGNADEFGKVWLLPYNTSKSSAESHPTGEIWYDELIISTQFIAAPGFESPASDPPPAAPTGLTISWTE
jgi:hypothetical protein